MLSSEIRAVLVGKFAGKVRLIYKSRLSSADLTALARTVLSLESDGVVVLDDQTRGKLTRISGSLPRKSDDKNREIILRPKNLKGNKRGMLLALAPYLESASFLK